MKKSTVRSLLFVLSIVCMFSFVCAFAEEEEDSAESLMELLGYMTDASKPIKFEYGDYDGDGIHEAFAFIGYQDEYTGYVGDLWFVSPLFCEPVQTGLSYLSLTMEGDEAPILFAAEEWYGGSGSKTHLWTVVDSAPVQVDLGSYEGVTYGGGNVFYSYPSAFDASVNGSGHTYKCYYHFLDGLKLKEYGGINISRIELEEFDNAREILAGYEQQGYEINDIIYRGNGVINVNICDGTSNENLTLRYDETKVEDTNAHYGGIYDCAIDPSNAVYPDAFVHPVNADINLEAISAKPEDNTYSVDFGKDGIVETIQFYTEFGNDEYDYYSKLYVMDVYKSDGQLANHEVLTSWGADMSDDWYDTCFRIAQISDDELYTEAMTHFEGTTILYNLYKWDGGKLVSEKTVRDPGYSDAEGLYDGKTNEGLYFNDYEETSGKYADGLSALNEEFGSYGLNFAPQEITFRHEGQVCSGDHNIADLSQEQLVCELYKVDFDASAANSIRPDASQDVIAETSSDDSALTDEEKAFAKFMKRANEETDDAADPVVLPTQTPENRYVRAAEDVNIRKEPNKGSGKLSVLYKGERIKYLNETKTDSRGVDWYKVEYNDSYGWVSSVYSSIESDGNQGTQQREDTSQTGGQKVTIVGGKANIRSGPGLNYETVGSMKEGRVVDYLGKMETDSRGVAWYYINFNGTKGWVSSRYGRLG